ncbi:hypothetical protein [Plantactinospora endophytica]|uniref:Uncharacterized protein n=1 Tax=Plantactinospora endophytica TaxID=673535 RepID=A0ABQ4DYC0_9ACTN|nr:hypothetical protein [Plantactinospora endophytica]GIG87454.1 hypothetical protein Pen02_23900 [Plantactinospora endophytica]
MGGPARYLRPDLERAIAAASRATGPEEGRPWLRLRDGAIDVLVTPPGAGPAAAQGARVARLGGGAGLFNVRLALAASGRPALVRLRPYHDEPDLLARPSRWWPYSAVRRTPRAIRCAPGRRCSAYC